MSMASVKASDPGSAWFGAGKYRSPGGGPTRNVRLVATSVAAFVSVLGLALLLQLYICRVRRRNRRRAESAAAAARLVAAKAPGKAGLEPSAIAALPTAAYEEDEEAGCSECAICLGAMEKGDAVRVLPACAHDVFHVACVDTWLASSSSCPVCRASVEPPPPMPNPAGWVKEKPELEKQDAAGSSTSPCGLGASLLKMLSRERPAPRRPLQVDQAHAPVEMDQFDLESQQQQQHAVNN